MITEKYQYQQLNNKKKLCKIMFLLSNCNTIQRKLWRCIWGPVEQCCSITQQRSSFSADNKLALQGHKTDFLYNQTKFKLWTRKNKHKIDPLRKWRWRIFNNDLKPKQRAKIGNETYHKYSDPNHTYTYCMYIYVWIHTRTYHTEMFVSSINVPIFFSLIK